MSADPSPLRPLTVKAVRRLFRGSDRPTIARGSLLACASEEFWTVVTGGPVDRDANRDAWLVSAVTRPRHSEPLLAMASAGLALGYRRVEFESDPAPSDFIARDLVRGGWVRAGGVWSLRSLATPGLLRTVPIGQRQANEWIDTHHSHLDPSHGSMVSVGVADVLGDLHCVAQVGITRARMLMDGFTAEVVRVASDRTKHAASMALGACWRAMRAIGYRRLVSYTLLGESGVSYLAAGWRPTRISKGGQWSRDGRPREVAQQPDRKIRWEIGEGSYLSPPEERGLRELIRSGVGTVQFRSRDQ